MSNSYLAEHRARYPLMQPEDEKKLLHQARFAGGHLISSPAASLARLRAEREGLREYPAKLLAEPISGALARLHLNHPDARAIPSEVINLMFVHTARAFPESAEIPRHSEVYRRAYSPAYRVVFRAFAELIPLILRVQSAPGRVLIGVDGMCASGKTTAAHLLAEIFGANLIHMDDFFLPPERKTAERLAEPGGNVDAERFMAEVFLPLRAGEAFSYRPYDCQTGLLKPPVRVSPARVAIVEGAYCLRPEFAGSYDERLVFSVAPEEQIRRIRARDGEKMLARFLSEWIPLENAYLAHYHLTDGEY